MSEGTVVLTEVEEEPKRRSLLVDFFIRLVREKPLGTVGGVIVLAMFFTGIFANILTPYEMNESHLAYRLAPPSSQFLLGTDVLGRDLLTRIIYGARISMIVGVAGAFLNILVALLIGLVSGFVGGKTDIVIQRFVDAFMCFPWLLIMLTIMVLVGSGIVQVTIVLGVSFGIWYSRVIRSAVIGIKENMYVEAAKATGCSTGKMLTRHILPNVTAPIMIVFTISMGQLILSEATLSFLGYGIPPPAPSWGGMLSGQGRYYMLIAPWLAVWPGLALSIVVFGINMFGDAMRDLLDPRLRGGAGRYGGAKRKKLGKKQE